MDAWAASSTKVGLQQLILLMRQSDISCSGFTMIMRRGNSTTFDNMLFCITIMKGTVHTPGIIYPVTPRNAQLQTTNQFVFGEISFGTIRIWIQIRIKVICLFDTTRVTGNVRDVIAMNILHQTRNRRTNRLKRKRNRLKSKRGGTTQ